MSRILPFARIAGFVSLLVTSLSGSLVLAQETGPAETERLEPSVRFFHLTSDDGLTQNSIEAFLQDRNGFLWIGTSAGLNRYDGYTFTTYLNDPNQPNGLSHNHIRTLYEDSGGFIWIGTEGGGVNKFDPRTETFTYFRPNPNDPNTIAGDRVFSILEDSQGFVWIGGTGTTGLNRYDPQTGQFVRYGSGLQNTEGYMGNAVRDLLEMEDGRIWMAGDTLISNYDPQKDDFTEYRAESPDEQRLAALIRDAKGNLWVGGQRGIYRVNLDETMLEPYGGPRGVSDLAIDAQGMLWITTGTGVYAFAPETREIRHHYQHDAAFADSLSGNSTSTVYIDDSGALWIGTAADGVNIYNPQQTQFAFYRHNPLMAATLAEGDVSALYTNGNDLWMGVGNTLQRMNFGSGDIDTYTLTIDGGPTVAIRALYADTESGLWVGTSGPRLFHFDMETGEFSERRVAFQEGNTPPRAVMGLYEDAQNRLWIGVNHQGLYRLEGEGPEVSLFEIPPMVSPENANQPQAGQGAANTPPAPDDSPARTNFVPRPPLSHLIIDRAGRMWYPTLNGFRRFDPRTETTYQFRVNPQTTGPDWWIEDIHEDKNGIVWLATRNGLVRFDPESEGLTYYTEMDGLPTHYVVSIQEDATGDLWLGTTKGLSRFTPETKVFRNYGVTDGLQGNEFGSHLAARLSDGRMVFAGANGLTVFYPQDIADSDYQPQVVLTDFQLANESVKVGETSVLKQAIADTRAITLTYDQNIVSFEFATLNFPTRNKNRYRFMLSGFDNDWNVTDSERHFTTYTNLPAGDYVFRVQGTTSTGTWSKNEVALALTITPPIWETPLFRLGVVIGALALIFAGYQWRVYAMRKRNRELEREVAERTQALTERAQELQTSRENLRVAKEAAESANRAKSAFLANMSHELRSPLNVILGFAQVINRNATLPREIHDDLGVIVRSGEHLLALINQVLDLSKIEAGHMTVTEMNVDLYRLLDDVEDMFRFRADDKDLQLLFDRRDDLPRYIRTDVVKLRQVLINLLSNAVKFTESGGITVRTRHIAREAKGITLEFEVEDSGPGIGEQDIPRLFEAFSQTAAGRQSQEGTGLGLSISHKFVRMLGGTITAKSEMGRGTIFKFSISCNAVDSGEAVELVPQKRIVGLEGEQGRYRILVVDDKWANRQVLVKLLAPLGFDIREAENGQEAIEITQVFEPHLIWMDMRMPIIDGYQATRRIKALPQGKNVVVVALTASAFDEERAVVLEAGCDDFVRKPFRTEEIFELLKKHLAVRFVYASDEPASARGSGANKIDMSRLKVDIEALPVALRLRLTEGIELGDIKMINESIARVREQFPTLADALGQLANRFEYDQLLKLMPETTS